MNKSTVLLLTFAALGLGTLIGVSFVDESSEESPAVAELDGASSESTGGAPRFRYIAPGDLEVVLDEVGRAKPSVTGENFVEQDEAWKSTTVRIELPVDGAVEYKAIVDQGDSIVFNWVTNRGRVYSDFHGHDEAFGEDFFVRYKESEGRDQSGMIVAAFSGEHGWYWLNLEDHPITITLKVAGFFKEIIRIEDEGE